MAFPTGTLGILRAAALGELIDLPSALGRLLATNFRVSISLANDLLAEDAERKAGAPSDAVGGKSPGV